MSSFSPVGSQWTSSRGKDISEYISAARAGHSARTTGQRVPESASRQYQLGCPRRRMRTTAIG